MTASAKCADNVGYFHVPLHTVIGAAAPADDGTASIEKFSGSSPPRAGGPQFKSQSTHTCDLKTGLPVVSLTDVWCCRSGHRLVGQVTPLSAVWCCRSGHRLVGQVSSLPHVWCCRSGHMLTRWLPCQLSGVVGQVIGWLARWLPCLLSGVVGQVINLLAWWPPPAVWCCRSGHRLFGLVPHQLSGVGQVTDWLAQWYGGRVECGRSGLAPTVHV